MVMMPEPVFATVEQVKPPRPLILLCPTGRTFDQSVAVELAALEGFSLLCGRYEGVDERIRSELCDDEISLGDFVLAGGELAALAVIEAVARLRPGVLGNSESPKDESFSDGLLEYPHWTRPAEFRGMERRPDLIDRQGGLSDADRDLLDEFSMSVPERGDQSVG